MGIINVGKWKSQTRSCCYNYWGDDAQSVIEAIGKPIWDDKLREHIWLETWRGNKPHSHSRLMEIALNNDGYLYVNYYGAKVPTEEQMKYAGKFIAKMYEAFLKYGFIGE